MGRLDGKVAFVTGAARGQGRSHAVRLAEDGADVVICDICKDIETTAYDGATSDDLQETVDLVEARGVRVLAREVDVRDQAALDALVADAIAQLGSIDIVSANAGICAFGRTWEITEEQWRDVVDIDLTGVWHTTKAVIPSMIDAGRGGSIVLTSSCAGLQAVVNTAHYTAAKHGVLGLMKVLANEVGEYGIRVNAVVPGTIPTPMVRNEAVYRFFCPGVEHPTAEDADAGLRSMNLLPIRWLEEIDISNAIAWLASDEARYVTGVALPVDAGWVTKTS